MRTAAIAAVAAQAPVTGPPVGMALLDSVGSSAADVVAVALVVEQAKKLGIGQAVVLNA